MDTNIEPIKQKIIRFVVSYLLSGVTGFIGIWDWFKLREMQRIIVAYSGISVWSWKAIDNFTFVTLGIIWLTVVLVSQHVYGKGFKNGRTWKIFTIITGIQLLIIFFTYLTAVIYKVQVTNFMTVLYMLLQFFIGVVLLLLPYRFSIRK